jgi:putative DNA primase/helicase
METENTTTRIVVENIPDTLKRRPQWVNWRFVERDGKNTKIPCTPKGQNASSTDLMTWSTFDAVLDAFEKGKYDGIGFVFCSGDPFVGVDLDSCRNPETGKIEEWAQAILDSFEDAVHVEISPSGVGVHIIARGLRREGVNTKYVEVYGQDRFFTMTGVTL